MAEVRLGTQGRIVLPRELREAMGAEEGAVYVATVEEGRLVLESREAVLRRMRDRLRDEGRGSLTDELLAERRAEAAADPSFRSETVPVSHSHCASTSRRSPLIGCGWISPCR